MNPRSADALNGLAGVYTKQQQYSAAANVYEQLLSVQPALARWLARPLPRLRARQSERTRPWPSPRAFPAQVKAALNKDPDYLHTLAGIYQAQNRDADAQRVLALALSLPFPDNGATLLADTKLQYAGILHGGQALRSGPRALRADSYQATLQRLRMDGPYQRPPRARPGHRGHRRRRKDARRPPTRPRWPIPASSSMLGAIYQQANQFEVAQGLLERAEKLQIAAGGQPSVALQLQLAAIYLLRNNTDQAYAIYRQVLTRPS